MGETANHRRHFQAPIWAPTRLRTQTETQPKPPCHENAYLTLSPTMKLARCFIGLRARLPSGICHQSMPSLYAKVSLFGLIRGVLPIFSQVPVLLNQELDSCFPWQTQGPGCPELPLADGGGGKGVARGLSSLRRHSHSKRSLSRSPHPISF